MTYRDLAASEIPFVDLPWIMGAYTAPETHSPEVKNALAVSDKFIGELLAADEIVIGTPMYNFNLPARLKAWIDHVVRHGKTFHIDATGYHGLAGGRKLTVIIASGGSYLPGAPAEGYNLEEPYLKLVFGFHGDYRLEFRACRRYHRRCAGEGRHGRVPEATPGAGKRGSRVNSASGMEMQKRRPVVASSALKQDPRT